MAAKLYKDLTPAEQKARDTELKDMARGAKFAPMDLLGAPVDLVTMGMRGVGIPVPEKPFLGSEYLIDKYADLGEAIGVDYDRPTGSASETAGRIIAGVAGIGGEAALLAPGIGKLFAKSTKTRGSGTEVKGSGNIEMEASPSDRRPMVLDVEAGADKFVPLEKKVGAPGTPGPEPAAINPLFNEAQPYSGDYSPLENVLIRSKDVLGAGKKGFTGEQMVSRLKKAGIKDDELESSGIASFIKENKTNKRPVGDYLEHYQKNAPDIRMEINEQEIAGGTQRIVTLPPGRRGEYEELVFFDQKVRDDPDLSPAATPYNLEHFRSDTLGPIGMARLDHIDDPITGGRATI